MQKGLLGARLLEELGTGYVAFGFLTHGCGSFLVLEFNDGGGADVYPQTCKS